MRTKESILEQFGAIQRHFLKQDLTNTEAQIQSLALVAECLLDLRRSLQVITEKMEIASDRPRTRQIIPDEAPNLREIP